MNYTGSVCVRFLLESYCGRGDTCYDPGVVFLRLLLEYRAAAEGMPTTRVLVFVRFLSESCFEYDGGRIYEPGIVFSRVPIGVVQ